MALLEIKTVVICNASRLGSKVTSHFCFYSSGKFKSDNHRPVSVCLACFWSYLAYFDERFGIFVHQDLATLHCTCVWSWRLNFCRVCFSLHKCCEICKL